MPDGKTPTTAETGIFSNPEYPVKGISINICSGTTPSLLQGTFCASFPKIIFIADCPGCPSDTLDIVICPYVFIIHHHPSKKRTHFCVLLACILRKWNIRFTHKCSRSIYDCSINKDRFPGVPRNSSFI